MEPVKFVALDRDDLEVVSTHLQDALVKVADVMWRPHEKRLVIALSRFDWLSAEGTKPELRRCRAALRFERVKCCKCRNVNPAGKDAVLNLLAVEFSETDPPAGVVNLIFSGGGALRLEVDSWRWKGVPFYIRAGKCLPVTCTEVVVRLRQPPTMYEGFDLKPNYCRLRISPDVTIAIGANVIAPGQETVSACAEMLGSSHPRADEMDAYERVLGDAMEGDPTLFAREDYVEEAWRIVDPALRARTPISEYEPSTWGPKDVGQKVSPAGGWQNPVVTP